jgi:hypothetical protein
MLPAESHMVIVLAPADMAHSIAVDKIRRRFFCILPQTQRPAIRRAAFHHSPMSSSTCAAFGANEFICMDDTGGYLKFRWVRGGF